MKFYIGSSLKNIDKVNYIVEKLVEEGWKNTFNWANSEFEEESKEDMIRFSNLEIKAIKESDVVIILFPAGRGTHIELGIALAENKEVYLCSENSEDFNIKNVTNFYELPTNTKIVGSIDEIIKTICEKIKNEGEN